MRSEVEYINRWPDALSWVAGCVVASYGARLADFWTRHARLSLPRLAASCAAVTVIGIALENRACGQTTPPAFTDTACELPHITPDVRPRLRCGVVAVPRDYAHPQAGQYRLAVVIIRSDRRPVAADPVVYMSGGPGGPLTTFASYQAEHPLAEGRDIILVDQRGTGHSEPSLCPSLAGGFAAALVEAAINSAAEAQRRALFAACRTQAVAAGIDLKDFGTPVTVEDFDQVRQALGIERWNLFGVSYGTTVAMTLMALHPETVRSAVLDSINPPDPMLPRWSVNVTDAVRAFLASCQADESCSTLYPDLAKTYQDTVVQLGQTPLSFPLPPGVHGIDSHGPLTAGLFRLVVGRLVYYSRFYPGLPRLIAHTHDGDTSDFAGATAALVADAQDWETGANFPANAAIDCRDRPRYRETLGAQADDLDRSLYGICSDWVPLGPPPLVPIGTVIPTLMIAGQFDPNARPTANRRVADLIGSHAQSVEFALAGHSVRSSNVCAAGITAAFIDHPLQPVGASCASRPAPIRFLSP